MKRSFSPVKPAEKPHVIAFKFQPGLKYELGHAHRLSCECKTLSCKFSQPNFKHCALAEIRHVIATKFQPRGRIEISARAEIRHVIGPFEENIQPETLNLDLEPSYLESFAIY